jgi:hypothetical protein
VRHFAIGDVDPDELERAIRPLGSPTYAPTVTAGTDVRFVDAASRLANAAQRHKPSRETLAAFALQLGQALDTEHA